MNYIIPTFILDELPVGLVGCLIAAIIWRRPISIAGELNSLSTATVIDFYRRCVRPTASDAHYLVGLQARDRSLGPVRLRRRRLGRGARARSSRS